MQTDETLGAGEGQCRLVTFVIGVGGFQLRLLGVAAVREATLKFFQILDGALVVAVVHFFLGGAVEALRAPILGFVLVQAGAAGEQQPRRDKAA